MAAATLHREERIGLVLAVAAHAGLIAWLALGRSPPEPLPLPDKVSVTLSDEVGLVATTPDPSADPAPDSGPQAGDSAPPGEPQPAAEPEPARSAPTPPTARPAPAPPKPTASPAPQPAVRPLAPRVAIQPAVRPVPRPAPRPVPTQRRDAIADLLAQRTPTTRPAARATAAARPAMPPPARPGTRPAAAAGGRPGAPPAARPGAPGFAEAFRGGVPGASGAGQPNAAPGPAEISSFKAVIRGRVIGPWNACSVTGLDVSKLRASVTFTMDKSGAVTSVAEPVMSGINDANRAQAKRFAECAVKAIRVGGPYKLPVEYYPYWKTYKFNFTKG